MQRKSKTLEENVICLDGLSFYGRLTDLEMTGQPRGSSSSWGRFLAPGR